MSKVNKDAPNWRKNGSLLKTQHGYRLVKVMELCSIKDSTKLNKKAQRAAAIMNAYYGVGYFTASNVSWPIRAILGSLNKWTTKDGPNGSFDKKQIDRELFHIRKQLGITLK
jgi:hypothetical protein